MSATTNNDSSSTNLVIPEFRSELQALYTPRKLPPAGDSNSSSVGRSRGFSNSNSSTSSSAAKMLLKNNPMHKKPKLDTVVLPKLALFLLPDEVLLSLAAR